MNWKELLTSIPGMSALTGSNMNVKFLLEIFSKRIISHVKHPVEKYQLKLIFETGFMEFLIYYPGLPVPDTYMPPLNLKFKGQERKTPVGARWYDMDVNGGMDMIKSFLTTQLGDFKGTIDYVIANVDRNSNKVPVVIAYTENGDKKKIEKVLQ